MNASPHAAAGRAVRIPLDRMPLDPIPSRPRARRAPRVSPDASREALLPASENLIREIAEINTAQAAEPPRRRRRPLSGFAKLEEKPSFYLSLSDLMSLLLVFFVLIFSLTRPGAPTADARPEAASAPAAASLGSAPRAQAFHDPMPTPEPVPRRIRLGLMAVSAQGQSDPGLAAEKKKPAPAPAPAPVAKKRTLTMPGSEDAAMGRLMDRALLTLVAATAPLPSRALPREQVSLSSLLEKVRREIKGRGMEVEAGRNRLVLRLPESITFDVGRARVKPGMERTLHRLARIMAESPRTPIVVTGHTDDAPINNEQFASNWELSAARAAAVARALMSQGAAPARFTIRGMADQKPRVPNSSPANRRKNRRVEIELRPLG